MANVMNLLAVQPALEVRPLEVAHLEHAEPVAERLHPSAICYTLISERFAFLYGALRARMYSFMGALYPI